MSELTTKRTLVKSPPELWAEVSDLEALAKHLGEFGEIRITRLEPETTVVWEGDRACGTVKLEASGWGTKVTLTAELAALEEEAAAPEPLPEPVAVEEPPPSMIEEELAAEEVAVAQPAKRVGFWARMFGRRKASAPIAEVPPAEPPAPDSEPPPVEEPEPEPAPVEEPEPTSIVEPLPAAAEPFDGDRAVAVLTGVLDNLGAAHHRPFSRG